MEELRERWPAVVVGAGAAGLFTALFAARQGARTLLLERKEKPGAKILISGGGRCNVLPSQVELGDFYTSGSPNTLRNLLFSWPLAEVREFFETDLGVPLVREQTGKLFPRSQRARDVLDALLGACERAGVELRTGFELAELRREPEGGFEIRAASGERVRAARVALATGGLSIPQTGSDGKGLALARELGLALAPCHPALVPLVAAEGPWRELAGIALPARVAAWQGERKLEERAGDLLFTHRGFSGPLGLDMSHHVTSAPAEPPGAVSLRASFGESVPWEDLLLAGGPGQVEPLVREHLPRRLAARLVEQAGVAGDTRLAELPRAARQRLLEALCACPLPVVGHEGYRKAEVTGGGVELSEVAPRTLEVRRVPGLYLAGELLDATGRIGGFNFLWAWVTGRRAGLAMAEPSR